MNNPAAPVFSRRDAIAAAAAAGAALVLPGRALAQPSRKRVLRVAHLTDMHIQPERGAFDGVAACLRHVQSRSPRPDLVVTGGDLIMDAMRADADRTRAQWDLFTRVLADECGLPVLHAIGNHDVWGWDKEKSRTTGAEAKWGKLWALDALALDRPYSHRRYGAWDIIVLDSVAPNGAGYTARLDDEQRAWLESTLASIPRERHVMVVSHIPIFSLASLVKESKIEGSTWTMPGAVMHLDAHDLLALFQRHGGVRLCVSGHIHKLDRMSYEGVSFVCGGAVSGAWWKGPEDRCAEGYSLFDLYDDGSFEHEYVTYGWTPRE